MVRARGTAARVKPRCGRGRRFARSPPATSRLTSQHPTPNPKARPETQDRCQSPDHQAPLGFHPGTDPPGRT